MPVDEQVITDTFDKLIEKAEKLDEERQDIADLLNLLNEIKLREKRIRSEDDKGRPIIKTETEQPIDKVTKKIMTAKRREDILSAVLERADAILNV